MTHQPRRPARLSRRILAFAASNRIGNADYGDWKAVTISVMAASMPDKRTAIAARVGELAMQGYLKRIIKGRGGLHHWKHAIFEITEDGMRRLELLNQDKRI